MLFRSHVRFGYLMQEHENISQAVTPYQLFKTRLDMYDRDEIAFLLSDFQFSPDVLENKIASLSPGERVRLVLALLSASGANTLVLDEPTNHLDLEAIEALEESLEEYPGAIILVTHDRRFLERMKLSSCLMLEKGVLSPIASYEEYERSVRPQAARVLKRLEERSGR